MCKRKTLCKYLDTVTGDIVLHQGVSKKLVQNGKDELDRMNELKTCFKNFPIIRSDSPLEYTFAVSIVVTPRSQAAFKSGRA